MVLNEVFALDQIGFPILSLLLFLPVLVIVLLYVTRNQKLVYSIALWGAMAELILACILTIAFVPEVADIQFVEKFGPVPWLGISYHLGVDGISILFIPVTALLTLLVVIYAEYVSDTDARPYLMATLALHATMIGAFVALDLVLFWTFFALELVPSYFLITRWGTGAHRKQAAREYVTFMLAGSALMLVGIIVLGVNAHAHGGEVSFDYVELLRAPVASELQTVVFFLMFFGFAVKAPVFPFHTWMPKVLEQGPVVGMSVFLVGLKLGTYGFIRFLIPLLPDAAHQWAWLMLSLGVAGMLYGAAIAVVQTNLRRLLAFSSLSHMGVVMLGLFAFNLYGLQGGLLQMINLGITGAGLYFVAGFLHSRVGPPELSAMGGLVERVPWLSTTYLIIALASVGLPGTGGFNGEHLVMMGGLRVHWAIAVAAGVGTFLTGCYFLWYFLQGFLGSPNAGLALKLADLGFRERVIGTALVFMIFWIGLDTIPFLRAMNGSLRAVEQRLEEIGGAL
ncbi:MAG: NuoM family protein [Vicinamibacterales bacterium]